MCFWSQVFSIVGLPKKKRGEDRGVREDDVSLCPTFPLGPPPLFCKHVFVVMLGRQALWKRSTTIGNAPNSRLLADMSLLHASK